MGVLQRFERRLEGLVEGAFARAFKGYVEPVEVASALQREAEDKKMIVGPGRVLVPNDYVVELGDADYERLAPYAEPLGHELAEMLREAAGENSWSFVGPVTVALEHVDDLDTGMFRVRSGVAASEVPHGGVMQTAGVQEPVNPVTAAAEQSPGVFPGNPRLVMSANGQAEAGSPEARATGRAFALQKPVTVIGRGHDVDIRVHDPGVSRQHLRIDVEGDAIYASDMGSTNGTVVDGQALTTRRALAHGSRIQIGSSVLVLMRDPLDQGEQRGHERS